MIIPSIDLMDGQTVQLVGGAEKALDAGDPRPLARSFGRVGEIAVIDLDAALGHGDNRALVEDVLSLAPCRVGGGIRDAATARRWLDAGAAKVILGTAAVPEVLRELPRERVIAAVDAKDGEVVVEGWQTRTGTQIEARVEALKPYVGGFLITFVEREGRMVGIEPERIAALIERAAPARVTVAGGIRNAAEVATIDRLGADTQVGMALYTGAMALLDVFTALLEGDAPWPTVCREPQGKIVAECTTTLAELDSALADPNLLRVQLDERRNGLVFTVRPAP